MKRAQDSWPVPQERGLWANAGDSFFIRMVMGILAAAILVMALLLTTGCASTESKIKKVNQDIQNIADLVVKLVPTPIPTVTPQGGPRQYFVKKGDSLWKITAKGGNPFLWPIIWKANRDQIVDPDWIEPGLDLTIPYGAPTEDIIWATKLARARPMAVQPKSMVDP